MDDTTTLLRDVEATLIPQGEPFTLNKGTPVVITHKLGGNFTVTTHNGMFRISRENADALGYEVETSTASSDSDAPKGDVEIDQVWEALRQVYDPEIPVNIVDLGLVYNVEITDSSGNPHVQVAMTLTAPGCGMGPVIAEDAEGRILSIESVETANVEIVWDPPWHQDMISEEGKMQLGLI